MHIKFCGITFRALAGSKFRGFILSWGVTFVDTLQLQPLLIINALLVALTINVLAVSIDS